MTNAKQTRTPEMQAAIERMRAERLERLNAPANPEDIAVMQYLILSLPERQRLALAAYYADNAPATDAARASGLTDAEFRDCRLEVRSHFFILTQRLAR